MTFANIDARAIQEGLFWIPLIPMLAALFNALFGWRMSKGSIAFVACGSVMVSFVMSLLVLACVYPGEGQVLYQSLFTWFGVPGIHIDLAYAVDRFSSILLLVITGIGFLIHVYSISYMSEERTVNFARFFAYLNLFVGMMLTLVMGSSLVVLFVGWEGVGLASYLLIGFWWDDEAKAAAGRKAFVANRIGDFGFLIGIFTLLACFGTVDMYGGPKLDEHGAVIAAVSSPLQDAIEETRIPHDAKGNPLRDRTGKVTPMRMQTDRAPVLQGPFKGASLYFVVTLAALLLFLGACGKSAQIPLYVWLPDAMAGPTPVSALIHAATMVTAGVYMLCRLNYLIALSQTAMIVISFIGVCTALFAAIIGTRQDDIKKVLAYSTVSQLGYMILGCGIGAYWAASLHLLTHAFFKACLFLGAGSVMHAMANETNIKKLGGLRKDIPWTHWTFLIATLAITGVVPLSGFFSKDAILDIALHSNWPHAEGISTWLYVLGTIGAGFTAYYMFRAYILTFWGQRRSLKDHHAHEAGLMTMPLAVLAFGSVVALVWGLPFFGEGGHVTLWQEYLNPIFRPGQNILINHLPKEEGAPWLWWGIALVVAWAGFGIAYLENARVAASTDLAAEQPIGTFAFVGNIVRNKFYVDEVYDFVIVRGVKALAFNLWNLVDRLLIDKVLVGIWGLLAGIFAEILRRLQNGSAQRYAAVMAIALVIILISQPGRELLIHLFPGLLGH